MCGSDVPSPLSATTPFPQTVCLCTLQNGHTSKFVNFYVYVFTKTRLHIIALNDNQCFYVLFLFWKKEFEISKNGDSEALLWSSSALLWPYLCITTERRKPHRHKKFYLKKSCQAKAETQSVPFQLTRSGVERIVMSHIEAFSNRDCYRGSATLIKVTDQDLEVLI